jgi:glycosyltransferase involved in cell wall biosynthesis
MGNRLDVGGTEKQLLLLAQALDPDNFRVLLGCICKEGGLVGAVSADWETAEFRMGGSFVSRTAFTSALALARHMRSNRTGIAHSFSFYSNILMIPVARIAGVPVVIGSHRQLGDLLTSLQDATQAALFRLCDAVVCNSRAAATRLTKHGVLADKVAIIPNAVPDEIFEVADARTRGAPSEVVRIGMIAAMRTVKNHTLFLRAAARLRRSSEKIEFVLIGDGPLRPELEALTHKLGLVDKVRFMGERFDMAQVLANLDVSVLTSSSESLPNAVTESMAAALPVVATRVGGIPEVIVHGKNGLLVSPDDEGELAEALKYIVSDCDARLDLARSAHEFASRHFRVDQVRDAYQRLYGGLADKHRGSGAAAHPWKNAD